MQIASQENHAQQETIDDARQPFDEAVPTELRAQLHDRVENEIESQAGGRDRDDVAPIEADTDGERRHGQRPHRVPRRLDAVRGPARVGPRRRRHPALDARHAGREDARSELAVALSQPLERISVEMVFRSLYHFARAMEQGQEPELIPFLVQHAKLFGLVKARHKRQTDKEKLDFEIWGTP